MKGIGLVLKSENKIMCDYFNGKIKNKVCQT